MASPAKRRKKESPKGINKEDNTETIDFHKIVQDHDIQKLRDALDSKKTRGINKIDANNRKAIVLAAHLGHHRMVKEFLKVKCHRVNHMHREAAWELHSPMHAAIASGHLQVVKTILDHGLHADRMAFHKFTPLMAACCEGNAKIVKLLLKYGANIEIRSTINALVPYYYKSSRATWCYEQRPFKSATALVYAVVSDHTECAKLLLEAGANYPGPINLYQGWEKDVHLIHFALANGNLPLAKLLVKKFGKGNSTHPNGELWITSVVKMHGAALQKEIGNKAGAYESRSIVNCELSNKEQKTLMKNLEKSFNYLLSIGCDIIDKPSSGKDVKGALYYAVKYKDEMMVTSLIQNGADVKAKYTDLLYGTRGLLTFAAKSGNAAIAEHLISHGAEYLPAEGSENEDGVIPVDKSTPFFMALSMTDIEITRLLLSADKQNMLRRVVEADSYLSPLLFYVKKVFVIVSWRDGGEKEYEMVDQLLDSGYSVNATDKKGNTALNLACSIIGDAVGLVDHLLKAGAVVNVPNKTGTYPLTQGLQNSYSCYIGNFITTVTSLIRHGANVNVQHKDDKGLRSSYEVMYHAWGNRSELQSYALFIVRCLHIAGYRFTKNDLSLLEELALDCGDSTDKILSEEIEMATKCLELKTICRAVIIASIQCHYTEAVNTLPLPVTMKQYLQFNNLPEFS